MKYLALCSLFLTLIFVQMSAQAQGFQGIVPIESSCSDVERTLKIKACESPKVTYAAGNEKVEIYLLEEKCQKLFQTRWNVPTGTVIAINIEYKESIPLDEFPIKVEKFDKSFSDVEIFYTNSDKSIEISTMSGRVVSVRYMPSRENRKLFCRDENARIVHLTNENSERSDQPRLRLLAI